jgi:signal transduction histidine kinase
MRTISQAATKRSLHISIIVLLAVSVVQVCWWFFDQQQSFGAAAALIERLYRQDAVAAELLREREMPRSDVETLFPHVRWIDGHAAVAADSLAQVDDARRRHMNRYAWEGGFFLIVLTACIGVLLKGLRDEADVRRRQDSFLAMVSHQFKTPLASLRLSTETMVMRQLATTQIHSLCHRMLDDLRRLDRLVSKILDSARLDRGRMTLNKTPISLAEAARHVVGHIADLAEQEEVAIEIDISPDLELHADPLALDNVLRNIIENAIAASAPAGGGKIVLRAVRQGDRIVLDVTDSGIGFAPENAALLFEKFSRLETPGRHDAVGTGLGLFIVQRLMQVEGGTVAARSRGPGTGATFTVEWPAAVAREA